MSGYDIIGDVHGCATALRELLDVLGYRVNGSSGAYEHSERQAVFVGDLVDRGPGQMDVLQIVKRMADIGSAQLVMATTNSTLSPTTQQSRQGRRVPSAPHREEHEAAPSVP